MEGRSEREKQMASRRILSRVSEAYGRMLLVDGLFQADGHPGPPLPLPQAPTCPLPPYPVNIPPWAALVRNQALCNGPTCTVWCLPIPLHARELPPNSKVADPPS